MNFVRGEIQTMLQYNYSYSSKNTWANIQTQNNRKSLS